MIRLLLFVGFLALYTPPASTLALVLVFFTGDGEILWRWGIAAARIAVRLAGIRVVVEGLEQLDPKQAYIFMANHVSNLDPPIVVPPIYRPMSILAKDELFRIPILGMVFRAGNLVPVNRRHREAAIESVRKAVETLRSGRSMVVFPEGTRSRTGRMLPFKKGPFHMAMESGIPVVPITISGTYEAWPKGAFRIKPGVVTLRCHAPVDPKDFSTREELMKHVWWKINDALPEPYRAPHVE